MDLIYRSNHISTRFYSFRITFPKLFLFYSLLLFVLPNDLFEITAIYTFNTTTGIAYNWNSFYVSYLHFPIIAYGLFLLIYDLFYKKNRFELPIFCFLLIILIKDIFLNAFVDNYMLVNNCFEYYWEFLVAFCFIKIFYKNSRNSTDFIRWFLVFGFANLIMLLAGVVIGHSSTSGEYAYRYTSPNLNQNSTGYLMLLCFALSLSSKYKFKWLFAIAFFAGIVLTGNRSGLLFSILGLLLFLIANINKLMIILNKGITWVFIIFTLLGLLVAFNMNFSNVNTRFSEMMDGIFGKGLINYITYDKTSGASRIAGLTIGLDLLHDNWLFGTGMSCYSLQHLWTINSGPSAFPHFEWICYWMMFGVLTIPIIYLLISCLFRCLRTKSIFWVFGLLIAIRTFTDGGLWQNSKNIFFIVYSFAILYYVSKEALYERKQRRINNYSQLQNF